MITSINLGKKLVCYFTRTLTGGRSTLYFALNFGFRKLLFLGRLLTGDKMALLVRNLFEIRSQSYFDANVVSLGVLPSICEGLHKYGLFSYFDSWFIILTSVILTHRFCVSDVSNMEINCEHKNSRI